MSYYVVVGAWSELPTRIRIPRAGYHDTLACITGSDIKGIDITKQISNVHIAEALIVFNVRPIRIRIHAIGLEIATIITQLYVLQRRRRDARVFFEEAAPVVLLATIT